MQIGRYKLFTDEKIINSKNVVKVISDAMSKFKTNALACERLLDIDAGYMPLQRTKSVRPDIDVQTVDSVANEISTFKISYHFGIPFTFVQRGTHDSGSDDETDAIALLNECYAAENLGRKQTELGRFVEICGIGYTIIDIKSNWHDGDSFFQYEVLDPRYSFVIFSSVYSDHRPMLGVTYRTDKSGNTYYTAFSEDKRFEIVNSVIKNGEEITEEWQLSSRSGDRNPLGMIPIIEWERNSDRMGVFEREVPEMERLNLIISDIGNDIDQETQAIWHANDVEFPQVLDKDGKPTGEIEKPQSNDWVCTKTPKDGRQPFIKALTTGYNYEGLLNNYQSTRALILQRCYTPQRDTTSGGSSGTAMSDATGWSAAEQVANAQQLYMESSKMQEVKVALQAIRKNPNTPTESPLLNLRYMDVKPNILRMKSYEMSVKTTALANLLSHGIHGLHALKAINFFDDVEQVYADSKDLIDEYQKNAFGEKEEIQTTGNLPDYQVGNTPLIDGLSLEKPMSAEDNNGETGNR